MRLPCSGTFFFTREFMLCLTRKWIYIRNDPSGAIIYFFDLTTFRFIATACRKYRNVPFHNFFHAFNVTQTMYYFLTTGRCLQILDKKAALAMLTAALCHDLDHPGLNNGFLIQAGLKIGSLHKRVCCCLYWPLFDSYFSLVDFTRVHI